MAEGPATGSCHKLLPFEPSHFRRCDLGPVHAGVYLEPYRSFWISTDDDGPTARGELWRGAYESLYYDEAQQQWISEAFPDTLVATLPGVVVAQPAGPEIFVVATTAFHLGFAAHLSVVGRRPIALVSTGDMLVEGAIHLDDTGEVDCANAVGRAGTVVVDPVTGQRTGSGGSGGGSSIAVGGHGGAGKGGVAVAGGGLTSGSGLLKGCRGGDGGGATLNGGLSDSSGGSGGGAIQLVSGGELRLTEETHSDVEPVTAAGRIAGASGRSGMGGASAQHIYEPEPEFPRGGGGGGSGGTIVLEAVDIVHHGIMSATGGGGAGGGGMLFSGDFRGPSGNPGVDTGNDGDGGAGGHDAAAASGEASDDLGTTGGGGGGGASGRIVFRATRSLEIGPSAQVSPSPVVR